MQPDPLTVFFYFAALGICVALVVEDLIMRIEKKGDDDDEL